VNKQEALSAIRWDVSGFAVGLLLGGLAFWLVRPKSKAASAFDMARRWLSWGVFAGFTSGTMFFFRHYEQGGIVGAVIGIVFWSGLSWLLGFLWGLVRFRGVRSSAVEATGPQTAEPPAKSSPFFAIGAVVTSAVLLGLVGVSFLRSKSNPESVPPVAQSAAEFPRHIAEGFLKPNSNEVDEAQLEDALRRGDPAAQYLMGMKSFFGNFAFLAPQPPSAHQWYSPGLPNSPPTLRDAALLTTDSSSLRRGFELLKAAADQGYPPALFAMYECYDAGVVVPKDKDVAASFFTNSLSQDYAPALLEAAASASTDRALRISYLRKAADQGHPAALYTAGRLVELNGRNKLLNQLLPKYGIEQPGLDGSNSVRVFDWQNESAVDAFLSAHSQSVRNGGDLAVALSLYSLAADQGYVPAMYDKWSLLVACATDRKYKDLAFQALQPAANAGFTDAVVGSYITYADGEIVPKDEVEALAWAYVAGPTVMDRLVPISQRESSMSAESRLLAQRRAAEINASILSSGSVWNGISKNYLVGSDLVVYGLEDKSLAPHSLLDYSTFGESSAGEK
jgi:TPR repeat protein